MRVFRDKTRRKLAMNFMFRYIVVMLIPIFMISIIYFYSLRMIEQDTIRLNISILEKTKDILENRLAEIDNIIEQIAWNTKVIRYNTISEPFKGANTYKTLETRSELYNYTLTNRLVFGYYVIYHNSGIVMGPEQTYRLEQFYNFFFKYNNMDYNEWVEEISKDFSQATIIPERQITFKGKPYNVLTYLRNLSITPSGKQCKILFLLKGDEIRQLLDGFNFSLNGWMYITDQNGSLITSSHFQPNEKQRTVEFEDLKDRGYEVNLYDGEKMLFTYIVSENTGWSYVAVQPYENVMEKVSYIKRISYIVFSGALILGLIIAFLWSNRNSLYLKNTYDLIPKHKLKGMIYKDPFVYIQNSVYEIIKDNQLLNHTIEQQISFLRSSFYQRLLNGDFHSETELKTCAKHIGLDFGGKAYAVSIIEILGYGQGISRADNEIMKELDIRRLMVKETLVKYGFTRTYYYDIAEDRIMTIYILGDQNFNEYREQMCLYIQKVRKYLAEHMGIKVRFAWGELCTNPLDLSHCLQKEMHVLDYVQINDGNVYDLWYPEIIDKQYGVFYPKEWEYRLINFSKEGNEERVKEIITKLQIENFIRRKLTPNMLKIFIIQLYGTLMRVMQESSIEKEEIYRFGDKLNSQYEIYNNYDENCKFILDSFLYVCKVINERKENQNIKLLNEIKKYIQQNYMDNSLSLAVLAERFNYSPAYLSIFFKEQMGINFSYYLEELRMEHAIRLLRETNLSIAEISDRVGYNSSNSFCRAFKRIFDMSPGEYRRNGVKQVRI